MNYEKDNLIASALHAYEGFTPPQQDPNPKEVDSTTAALIKAAQRWGNRSLAEDIRHAALNRRTVHSTKGLIGKLAQAVEAGLHYDDLDVIAHEESGVADASPYGAQLLILTLRQLRA